MIEKVFSVSGNKTASMIIDVDSLKFSSKKIDSFNEFKEVWKKNVFFNTETEIEKKRIWVIQREENSDAITIMSEGFTSYEDSYTFSFNDRTDYDTFFNYFITEENFTSEEVRLTPSKAIDKQLLISLLIITITALGYYRATAIAGGKTPISSGRGRSFDEIVGALGPNGVIIAGGIAICSVAYAAWKRYTNPPKQLELKPTKQKSAD